MSFQHHGADAIEYAPCYYQGIDIPFRGPKRELDGAYIACLGGAGMFGKFVPSALPDVLGARLGIPAVNLGQVNGGVDFMVAAEVLDIVKGAVATVVELVGAQNLSNRFYRVHPRRNDRVIGPTPLMRQVFPELELTDVHFTRHLLGLMQAVAPARTETVLEDLRQVWLERMHLLLGSATGPVILVWMGGGAVPVEAQDPTVRVPFVDETLVSRISRASDDLVVIDGRDMRHDLRGMRVPEGARPQLRLLPTACEIGFAAERVAQRMERHLFRIGRVGVGHGP